MKPWFYHPVTGGPSANVCLTLFIKFNMFNRFLERLN